MSGYFHIFSTHFKCLRATKTSLSRGAIPKEILDKAKSEISAAEAAADEQAKALENIETPEEAEK
jgi:hypothetical protein